MKISLKPLISNRCDQIIVEHKFDDELSINYNNISFSNIKCTGKLTQAATVIHLLLNISFTYDGICDRCCDDVHKDVAFSIDKIVIDGFINDSDSEKFDDYIICEQDMLDLNSIVHDEIILHMPSKILCREDCKGLCPNCGKNLNYGSCNCNSDLL